MIMMEIKKQIKRRSVQVFFVMFLLLFISNFKIYIPHDLSNKGVLRTGEEVYGLTGFNYMSEINRELGGTLTDAKIKTYYNKYMSPDFEEKRDYLDSFFLRFYSYDTGFISGIKQGIPNADFEITYGHYDSWENMFLNMKLMAKVMIFFIIVLVAPIFSYDYHTGVQAIITTSKKGKKAVIHLKQKIVFIIINGIWLGYVIGIQLIYFIKYHGEGYNTSIQVSNGVFLSSYMEMSYMELMIHYILLVVFVLNAVGGLVLLLAYKCKNATLAATIMIIIIFFIRADFIRVTFNSDVMNYIANIFFFNIIDLVELVNIKPIDISGIQIPFIYIVESIYAVGLCSSVVISCAINSRKKMDCFCDGGL